jgi:hypothetical protein
MVPLKYETVSLLDFVFPPSTQTQATAEAQGIPQGAAQSRTLHLP